MEQHSEEWFKAKLGKVSASRIHEIMPYKNGYRASRKNYMAELLCERLTGKNATHFESAEMRWGTENESLARGAYEAASGEMVEECGFIDHPTIPMAGASPDGLVRSDTVLEIKCPNTATHLETLFSGLIDKDYEYQYHFQIMCTKRSKADFVSYDPRLSEKLSLCIIHAKIDRDLITQIENEVKNFLFELNSLERKCKEINYAEKE